MTQYFRATNPAVKAALVEFNETMNTIREAIEAVPASELPTGCKLGLFMKRSLSFVALRKIDTDAPNPKNWRFASKEDRMVFEPVSGNRGAAGRELLGRWNPPSLEEVLLAFRIPSVLIQHGYWMTFGLHEVGGEVYVTCSDKAEWDGGPNCTPVKASEYHLAVEAEDSVSA